LSPARQTPMPIRSSAESVQSATGVRGRVE
jgi:hypothetical protein